VSTRGTGAPGGDGEGGSTAAWLLSAPLESGTHNQQLSEDAPRHDKAPQPWGAGMCIMERAGIGRRIPHAIQATRQTIDRGATAGDLSASIRDNFGVSNARASQHPRILSRARLVNVTADAQWRWYTLFPKAAQPLIEWLRSLVRSY